MKKLIIILILLLLTSCIIQLPKNLDQFDESSQKYNKENCPLDKKYLEMKNNATLEISLPFDQEDYYTKYWGMVPYCANPWNGEKIHRALDFELKPNAKVYAVSDGIVEHTNVGQEEGSGEIISVSFGEFKIDYSGLTNIQFQRGDEIKKGDYIGNAVQIPHGEYHVHLGISSQEGQECPIKYMDEEFKTSLKQMFTQAHYPRQSRDPCICNC